MSDAVGQNISNLDHIIINHTEQSETNRNRSRETKLCKSYRATAMHNNKIVVLISTLSLCPFFVALLLPVYEAKREKGSKASKSINKKTTGNTTRLILTFAFFQTTMLAMLPKLVSIVQGLMTVTVLYEAFPTLSVLGTTPPATQKEGWNVWQFPNYGLFIENIAYAYPNSPNEVIRNLRVHIPAGVKWMIMGPSGIGKSTLLKILYRLAQPTRGTIRNGKTLETSRELHSISLSDFRKHCVYIHQNTHLFPLSILDNILYGVENAQERKELAVVVKRWVKEYGFDERLGDLSRSVGVEGKDLSLGMQKLVIMLRGLLRIRNAAVILMDEPYAALDEATRLGISKIMTDVVTSRQTMIVTNHIEVETLGLRHDFFDRVVQFTDLFR